MKEQQGGVPHFLCIGPTKTGTSWLYTVLREHPEVFLTPQKEIRYFCENDIFPTYSLRKLFSNSHWYYPYIRRTIRGRLRYYGKILPRLDRTAFRNIIWDLRFFLLPHSDAWYVSLFRGSGGKVCGDISPQYYNVSPRRVRQIKERFPWLKILVFVRDPVERVWSEAKMNILRQAGKTNVEDMPEERFFRFAENQQRQFPDYGSMIEKWRNHFPQSLHVGFYDMLKEDPCSFFSEVCNFIGVETESLPRRLFKRMDAKVNVGIAADIPEKFAAHLGRQYRDSIAKLSDQYKPYPQRWLARLEKIL